MRDGGCGREHRTSYLREKEQADWVDWNLETVGTQSREHLRSLQNWH